MWDLEQFKNNIAVKDDKANELTYAELNKACEELSNAVGKRCLVFSMCDNVIGSLIGYIGFINGRIVPAMIKHDLDAELLKELYDDYKPAFIWISEEEADNGVFFDCKKEYSAFGYVLLRTPFGNETRVFDELGLLLATSGSTGSPKFVRQSYQNIRANTDSIVEYLHLDETEKPITTLPMNYTYGISIINTHIDVGATILLTDKTLMQREFWQFFKSEEATSFGGVPYTYEMLKRLRFFNIDLPSLRAMTQAGGKLLPELHKEFAEYAKEKGKEFVVMYGQCEATARMAYLPPNRSIEKFGSMGIAIPGGRFELIDVDGTVFDEIDKTGELVYYGDNVTLGYATSGSDLIKGDERGGKLVTGDMAKMDADGYYYIVGRKKRFLKIFGNRVNLDDAERMLKSKFEVSDVACGGVDDKLYIFGSDESKLHDMKEYLAEKTKLNIVAFKTVKVDSIPHNESGKTVYKDLEKYYE